MPAIKECILDVDIGNVQMALHVHLMKGSDLRSVIMQFHIMTLFPEMVMNGLEYKYYRTCHADKGLLAIEAVNIRDYAFNKHNSVDDYPYGGGAGMLMQAEPVVSVLCRLCKKKIEAKACAKQSG